jgi:hypothetical protein
MLGSSLSPIPLVPSLLVALLLHLHMLRGRHLAARAAWALTGLVVSGAELGQSRSSSAPNKYASTTDTPLPVVGPPGSPNMDH